MTVRRHTTASLKSALLAATVLAAPALSAAQTLSTGQTITPTAAPGAVYKTLNPALADHPQYRAGQAINAALSPDGKTLLVVTSGYNLLSYSSGANAGQAEPSASTEYVFVYDVHGAKAAAPVRRQVLQVPNTFIGLTWSPDGSKFYVAGGASDAVYVYANTASGTAAANYALQSTINLGHPNYGAAFSGSPFAALGAFLGNGIGFTESAAAAGLALTPDGTMLVVTNIYNDSISLVNTATGAVAWEYDLRPYKNNPALTGTAGGENPIAVVLKGTAATGYTAYVSSVRDREIVVVPIAATAPAAGTIQRIALPGSPNRMLLSADQSRLYVTQDHSDDVAVIDTTANAVLEEIDAIAPPGTMALGERYTGVAPNSLALSPDGGTLYVTEGGANAVAVINLTGTTHAVTGLIPTGWYPHAVTLSADGTMMYVVNGKSVPGPNPKYETGSYNQYILQREAAGLLSLPVPTGATLATLTQQVVANNGYATTESPSDATTMAALRGKIQHVIYIIKENRTFDQVLGDLKNGANADKHLTMYGNAITPNFHSLASGFVTLDNFYCSGEVSGNGWSWSTQGRESDFGVKTIPMNYAGRGSSNDSEGLNRNVNIGFGGLAARIAGYPQPFGANYPLYAVLANVLPGGVYNLLPGTNDDFATDGPNGLTQQGHLWDAALRAGLTVRDYGFFNDLTRYEIPASIGGAPLTENPFNSGTQMAWSSSPALTPYTDTYFRGFDNAYPDAWRWEEWNREFQADVTAGSLPALSLVRFMHDHTGSFSTAAAGVNTPELQQADNDFAVGKLVQTVANSPFAGNTLIFVLEDDAQDGPDHVDAHRSTAYIVGPYVKQHAVVSTRYSTVNMLRTIEDILGVDHLSLNDAYQGPMSDVFDLTQSSWSYTATASSVLYGTGLVPLLPSSKAPALKPTHDAAWWAARTQGYDWSAEDRIPTDAYNRLLWQGLKGDAPYPAVRGATGGKDND